MRRRSGLLGLLAIAVLLGSATSAFAQVSASVAQLNGTVQDESGAVVAKASITLREMDTNRAHTATSNDAGFYVLPNLPPGRYELSVEYTGFGKYTQTGIVLSVGQTATIDVTLKVAAKGEQVVVTGEAPTVEPTRTERSQVIDTREIQSLPISGRLFTDFALLTPGVATGRTSLGTTFTEFEVTRISFGGMRDFSNQVTVDGADNINTATASQRATPSQEAVSEFRVVNNSFGAEYGRALGGIVNIVTKSGTNEFHGSVYDYLQNSATNARLLLQPKPQANTLRQNQFGGTLGGPIRKDKTFFFLNYEGRRRGESPTYPPELSSNLTLINAAKAAMGIAPENLNILKTQDSDNGIVKMDHQFNKDTRLTVRYNIFDTRNLNQLVGSTLDGGGIGTPSGGRNTFIRDQSLVGTLTSNLKPDLVNTALVQYARRHYNFPGATGEPDLSIPNTLEFGHNFGTLDSIFETRVQISDSLAWVKGNHLAKFGVDVNYVKNFVLWPGFTPTRIILPGLNCLVDFANFVNINNSRTPVPQIPGPPCPLPNGRPPFPPFLNFNGTPVVFWGAAIGTAPSSTVQGTVPLSSPISTTWQNAFRPDQAQNFFFHLNHSYFGFFAQDQWRVTPKLTLNYGLRYDFEAGLSEQINVDHSGVQPRIGLAYSPDRHTIIRAGFGIFVDRYNTTFFFINGPQRPGVIPGITLPMERKHPERATYVVNQLNVATFIPGPPGAPPNFQFNAPAIVARTILLTGAYPPQYLIGDCPPNCTAVPGGSDHKSRIPYSLQASLQIDREIGKGLTVSGGYLFIGAHHQVRGNNLNVACPDGTSKPGNPPIAQGLLNPDGSISPCTGTPTLVFGKQHFTGPSGTGGEFKSSVLYDYNNNVANAVYHGLVLQASERVKYFRLNANYTFSKTIDDGNFTTFINLPQDQYRIDLERSLSNQHVHHRFIANFVAEGPEKSFLRNFTLSSIITLQSGRPFSVFVGFDANNDTNPVTDRVGLIGRNTYIGDGLYSVDLHVSRYFQLRERLRLELSVDAFNLFNRPNVDEVATVYAAPVFVGPVPRHYKDGVTAPNPAFGLPRTVFNPRQFQFAAKFSF